MGEYYKSHELFNIIQALSYSPVPNSVCVWGVGGEGGGHFRFLGGQNSYFELK